jgi:hypothetical protein
MKEINEIKQDSGQHTGRGAANCQNQNRDN